MCPFCLTTIGLVVAGTVSTGGLAALAVKVSRMKSAAEENRPEPDYAIFQAGIAFRSAGKAVSALSSAFGAAEQIPRPYARAEENARA